MTSELLELSSVIGDIYDAAIDATLWKSALGSVCAYVGGYSATLFWHDSSTQSAQALHLFNDDPAYTRLYFEKYVTMDPFFPASGFMEVGIVHSANQIVPQAELEQTQFYKEWIEPQGIADAIAVNLEKGVTRSSFIVVRTDAAQGKAEEGMYSRLAALVPHLQRAVSIGRLFDTNKDSEESFTKTLDHVEAAVFLVKSGGAISFANDAGQKLLEEASLVEQRDGVLHAIGDSDRVLHDVFSSSENGDASIGVRGIAVPLASPSDDPWFAHVMPLTSGQRQQAGLAYSAVAAVFIRKRAPNAPLPMESIARLYSLTASEIRVLDAVVKAGSVKAIAEMLGLSQATVKTHLHNLFRKTATRRQSDLVKLIAGI